tara:strand:+ start:127 stop:282 length:156 start_codon:yes stop_codon:yes gene_type:complete
MAFSATHYIVSYKQNNSDKSVEIYATSASDAETKLKKKFSDATNVVATVVS